MQCPVCGQDQVIVEVDGIELDLCIDAHGIWFDTDELGLLFEAAGERERLADLLARLGSGPVRNGDRGTAARTRRSRRRCPRCRRKMVSFEVPGRDGPVTLDRCSQGDGIWFDAGELEQVISGELSGEDEALARVLKHVARFTQFGETGEGSDA